MRRVHAALRGLSPGYFALVMATDVVSIGLDLEHHHSLSELVEDFTHPLRGFGF